MKYISPKSPSSLELFLIKNTFPYIVLSHTRIPNISLMLTQANFTKDTFFIPHRD